MEDEKQKIIIAIILASLFVLLFGFITFMVIANYVRRKRKLILEAQKREAFFKEDLLNAQLEMQEHTLNAVSQEIHDNVGQILSLAIVHLNIKTNEDPQNEYLKTIKNLVLKGNAELRELSTSLMTVRLLEEGLFIGIRRLLEQIEKTGQFKTFFQSSFENLEINNNKSIFLYRIIQEVLNNVLKHSKAKKVGINIFSKDEEVIIQISDDGIGFESKDPMFKNGIGLKSIEQRAIMIGAVIEIQSHLNLGTIVNLKFKGNTHDKNSIG